MAAAVVGVGAVSALAGERDALVALQASTIALAGAAASLLDEPRAALDALPTTVARRRALLLAGALPLMGLVWCGMLSGAAVGSAQAGLLTLQLVAVVALALGLGARGDVARAVAGVGLAFGVARVVLGPHLFPAGPAAAHWISARGWWAGAACAGLALLVGASRDHR
jgi:hypothetical protein